jgi:polar amino acid transport system permease protein
MLKGIPMTLQLLLYGTLLAAVLSFVFGLARLSRFAAVRGTASVLVELIRGTSLIVQLFWIYYALPHLGIELPKLPAAVIAIGVNYGAYGSEIVRSAILAVPKGQREAAIALNFNSYQRMRYIIVPQALLRMLPPFGNLQVELLKGTALAYFIGLGEVFYRTMTQLNYYLYLLVPIFAGLLVIYFALSQLVLLFYRWAERRLAAGRM